MSDEFYIAMGTRGTSLTDLRTLSGLGLHDGVNELPKPIRSSNPIYLRSHAWVTNKDKGDSFTLMRLNEAVSRGLVIRLAPARWRSNATGKIHEGEAFFPRGWKPGDPAPEYVAVRSPTWSETTLETRRNRKNAATLGQFEFSETTRRPLQPENEIPEAGRRRWTRDELLVALNLYHKIPFSHFDAKKPVVREVASRLGRTPGSLAMKLGNLASLDPVLKMRGIAGLPGASDLDREMWDEFHSSPEISAAASEEAFRKLFSAPEDAEVELVKEEGVRVRKPPLGATEVTGSATFRRGQEYFRQIVLNNFDRRCGVTQIDVGALLIASHILPWKGYEKQRLEVRNGICLSRLHDAAFDRGLMSGLSPKKRTGSAQVSLVMSGGSGSSD